MAPKPRTAISPPTKAGESSPPSQRGATSSRKQSSRKKNLSTAEKLEQRDKAKKEKSKQVLAKVEEREAKLPEVDLDVLEPIGEVCAPTETLIAELKSKVDTLEKRKETLRPAKISDAQLKAQESATAAIMAKSEFGRVWKGLAEERLAEMASSLEGALMNDDKLNALFEKIDIDKSGTIDTHELTVALGAQGKALTDEQVQAMLDEVRGGGGGRGAEGVTAVEFGHILKGLKAANAATVIETRVRQKAKRKQTDLGKNGPKEKPGDGEKAATAIASDEPQRIEFERQLGDAMLHPPGALADVAPRDLVLAWDRKKKGAISKVEFRIGVREDLGLRHAGNALIDAYFSKFDVDGGGTIDVPELRDGLDWLRERSEREAAEYETSLEQITWLNTHITKLETSITEAKESVDAVTAEVAKLAAHRATPNLDARIGEKLLAKLRTEENPKGLDLADLVAKWDMGPIQGSMSPEEFVRITMMELTGTSLKKVKSEAKKAAVTEAEGEAERSQITTGLEQAGTSEAEVLALFDALYAREKKSASSEAADAASSEGAAEGSSKTMGVKSTIDALMAYATERKSTDEGIFASCEALKATAAERQASVKAAIEAFKVAEVEAEAAAKAKAEAAAREKEEKAAAAKEAAEKAKEEAAKLAAEKAMPRHLNAPASAPEPAPAVAEPPAALAEAPAAVVVEAPAALAETEAPALHAPALAPAPAVVEVA